MTTSMNSQKPRILFICRHNSGRSQIAEAYLKQMAGDRLDVGSAGFEPAGHVHPLVVAVMREEGIDLTDKIPQSVFELFSQGRIYSHVVTVCNDSEGKCPVYAGITHRIHRPFTDPSSVSGTQEERLAQVRSIRDQIKGWLSEQLRAGFFKESE
jgi:arsenate reductase (thioredoxin)